MPRSPLGSTPQKGRVQRRRESNLNVFIIDTGNHTIRQMFLGTAGHPVTTVRGLPGSPGTVDQQQDPLYARFNQPTDCVFLTRTGLDSTAPDSFDLYVAEAGSHRVRRINTSPRSRAMLPGPPPVTRTGRRPRFGAHRASAQEVTSGPRLYLLPTRETTRFARWPYRYPLVQMRIVLHQHVRGSCSGPCKGWVLLRT